MDRAQHRTRNWFSTLQTACWIAKPPKTPKGCWKEHFLKTPAVIQVHCPECLARKDLLEHRVENTPYEREIARIIVKESLVGKPRVIWVGLIEHVIPATTLAFHGK